MTWDKLATATVNLSSERACSEAVAIASERYFVRKLQCALLIGARIIIFGRSGAGKTTLQLCTLDSLQDLKQIFVYNPDAPLAAKSRIYLTLVSENDVNKTSLVAKDFKLVSHYELKMCAHQRYIERNESPICSQQNATFIAKYWRDGKGGTATVPIDSSISDSFAQFSTCFPELARHATHLVNIQAQDGNKSTERIWELYGSTNFKN